MDFIFTVIGFLVGGIVGLTGVGGGSLMTPVLLFLGISPGVAVGTDLLYATFTKVGAVWVHHSGRTVRWGVAARFAAGSLPGVGVAIWLLEDWVGDTGLMERVIVITLSFSLILTAVVTLLRDRLQGLRVRGSAALLRRLQGPWQGRTTVVAGFVIGVLVTLSSVGAGALGTAVLLVLYPRMRAIRVVGTDLAHSVPLTALAGLGYLQMGNVDFALLGALLLGSLPGIYLGGRMGQRLPEHVMRPVLGGLLLIIGVGVALGV